MTEQPISHIEAHKTLRMCRTPRKGFKPLGSLWACPTCGVVWILNIAYAGAGDAATGWQPTKLEIDRGAR